MSFALEAHAEPFEDPHGSAVGHIGSRVDPREQAGAESVIESGAGRLGSQALSAMRRQEAVEQLDIGRIPDGAEAAKAGEQMGRFSPGAPETDAAFPGAGHASLDRGGGPLARDRFIVPQIPAHPRIDPHLMQRIDIVERPGAQDEPRGFEGGQNHALPEDSMGRMLGDFTHFGWRESSWKPLHFNRGMLVPELQSVASQLQEKAMNFDQAPMLVIWEVTQACDLACVHCRASAQPGRHPQELSTRQGLELLDEIKSFGNPLMVFTGGDPLKRPDLYDLLRHSVEIGLRTNVTPSATPLLTEAAIDRFQECGVSRMAISLDGPDARSHDDFRGIPGTFDRALGALHHAKKIGLETQLQTTVTRRNLPRLPEVAQIAAEVNTKMWSLFFLIVTGRALENDYLAAEEYEQVFAYLYNLSKTAPFAVKTTEAMHYRRYVAQRMQAEHRSAAENEKTGAVMWRTAGVSDGKGFVFVSHTGEIFPSGFLPVTGGNVLRDSLTDVYQNSSLFRSLRDVNQREGKCGICEYQKVCGGSRSRAYALTGNYLAEDPRCVYQPHWAEALAG